MGSKGCQQQKDEAKEPVDFDPLSGFFPPIMGDEGWPLSCWFGGI
jgi:hypothetical protein